MQEITPEYLASQGLSNNFPERFFSRINYTSSCWFWSGGRRKKGLQYGQAYRGIVVNGSTSILAHRASWIIHFGPVPDGLCVCHDCPDGDCPWCVNPAHLWLGTEQENIEDMWNKERGHSGAGSYFGEERWNAKLTNEQADEIRRLYKTTSITQRELSKQFGIARPGIGRIVKGLGYRDTEMDPIIKPKRKLTPEQESEIVERYRTGGISQQVLAVIYGVSQVHISCIVLGKRRIRIPESRNNS